VVESRKVPIRTLPLSLEGFLRKDALFGTRAAGSEKAIAYYRERRWKRKRGRSSAKLRCHGSGNRKAGREIILTTVEDVTTIRGGERL
jgi:hypothetical protein